MKYLKITLLTSLLVLLAACSSTGNKDGNANGSGTDGAQTAGVGSDGGFSSADAATQERLLKNNTYYFDYDQTTIHPADMDSLKAHAQFLVAHPKQIVLLAGNTDERGSREYNIGLGWRRAQSVSDLLKANGVNADQIKMVSYGAEKPEDPAHTDEAYAKNRRVVLLYCKTSNCQDVYHNDALKTS